MVEQHQRKFSNNKELQNQLFFRLSEEPIPSKLLNNKIDLEYIAILQKKYFNIRNPDHLSPYLILNLKTTRVKVYMKPNRDFSITTHEDVPQFQALNTSLIQPILNFDRLQQTIENKLNKLLQRNTVVLITIKKYENKFSQFLKNINLQDEFKEQFNLEMLKFNKVNQPKKKFSTTIELENFDKITYSDYIKDSNTSDRYSFASNCNQFGFQVSTIKHRQLKIQNKINNLKSFFNQQKEDKNNNNLKLKSLGNESNRQVIDDNISSIKEYAVDSSFFQLKVQESQTCHNSVTLKSNQLKDHEEYIKNTQSPQKPRKYKFRQSQVKIDNIIENLDKKKQLQVGESNKSIEKLTLKPIDYLSVCSVEKKIITEKNEQFAIRVKPQRFQTQEKTEQFEFEEFYKTKKRHRQSLRNALMLLTNTKSEQLLTSLIASGAIKHQQYQSFLQPIKVVSTSKYLTPK